MFHAYMSRSFKPSQGRDIQMDKLVQVPFSSRAIRFRVLMSQNCILRFPLQDSHAYVRCISCVMSRFVDGPGVVHHQLRVHRPAEVQKNTNLMRTSLPYCLFPRYFSRIPRNFAMHMHRYSPRQQGYDLRLHFAELSSPQGYGH